MFRIEMLPASDGDCLWIEYGDRERPWRLLIDGGRGATYETLRERLAALPRGQRNFELLMLSHVDADHIGGLLELVEDQNCPACFKDVWFNGYHHLFDTTIEEYGPAQGERLTDALVQGNWPWNEAFNRGGPAVLPDVGDLPVVELEGGMKITLLSPTWPKLRRLQPIWEKECRRHGIVAGVDGPGDEPEARDDGFEEMGGEPDIPALAQREFEADSSVANGSSLAVFAEFENTYLLLSGDAHVDALLGTIPRLPGYARGQIKADAFKMPHHGSKKNVSRELIGMLDCPRYLVSSNGARHRHPDMESIARVIHYGDSPEIVFNYRTEFTEVWDIRSLMRRNNYRVRYPETGADGYVEIDLLSV